MPTHAEKRVLPHTREQMFDLVIDIEKYPEFLPWCVATRIRQRDDEMDSGHGDKTDQGPMGDESGAQPFDDP